MAAEARVAAAEPARPILQHWSVRVRDALSTYLPLLLMLLLAGLSWWLVRITPVPPAARLQDPANQTPDFTLQGVEMVRYRADGRREARIRGRELRHFPFGERVEIDDARIQIDHPDGPLEAQSLQATVTEGGQRVALRGEVRLTRAATARQPAFSVEGESIDLDSAAGRAWSQEPILWTQNDAVVRAAGFDYRQQADELMLRGPVQARLEPLSPRRR